MPSYTVPAPPGYQANVCFNVDSRAWYPYFREVGATFWTQCMPFGHGQTPVAEVIQRASELVAQRISIQTAG